MGGIDPMDSIILIGPRQWGEDHRGFIKINGATAIQYSAIVSSAVVNKLEEKRGECFELYIYVPKRYNCAGKTNVYLGSGKIEFRGNVIDFKVSETPIPSPWKTLDGPRGYDKHDSFEYEFWFKLESLEICDLDINQFEIYSKGGTLKRYSITDFARQWRGKIVFANSPTRHLEVKPSKFD